MSRIFSAPLALQLSERNELTSLLARLGAAPIESRGPEEIEIASGLLICGCGRWFPIVRGIPELLPDHLRDDARELELLEAITADAPVELTNLLRRFRPGGTAQADIGTAYKKAEINIRSKVDEPLFFVPGETSPFAPWAPHFSLYLIKLFGVSAPLLNLQRGEIVLDSGCGYAWTTEWLFRSGFDPIGVDICRTYLDIAVGRMGAARPHLVVADVENLPFVANLARAVLAYESFHHIPDRRRALSHYERVLEEGGTVILAEPGGAHEEAQVAVDAMEKYGILEKGMELSDVRTYAEGTTFGVEQLFLVRFGQDDVGKPLSPAFVKEQSAVEGNLFRLVKGGAATATATVGQTAIANGFVTRARARLGAAASWIRRD